MNSKVYVPVITAFDEDGRMRPCRIRWEDGSVYSVDRVVDVRPAPAMKAGGQGDRYTVMINGAECRLFFETATDVTGLVKGRWFVERREG